MSLKQCAVIGVGGIGKWHAKMMNDTGKCQVVALCDANEGLREWAAKEHPQARFYTHADDLFAKENLDLVAVVTPHNLHAPIAINALRHGINVITEKPMATSYQDALAMVAAAKAANRFVTVFHNRRLDPWFLAAKKAVTSGILGRIIELNTGINYGPSPQTWRGFLAPSGGLQFDWGAHLVDYSLQLLGNDILWVSGSSYRRADKPADQVEDQAVTTIQFASGAVARITTRALATVQPQRYHIVGEQGTLIDEWSWGDQGSAKVHTKVNGFAAVVDIPYTKTTAQEYYNNIAAHLTEGAPLLVSGESAAEVIKVLCAGTRSAANGGQPQAWR